MYAPGGGFAATAGAVMAVDQADTHGAVGGNGPAPSASHAGIVTRNRTLCDAARENVA